MDICIIKAKWLQHAVLINMYLIWQVEWNKGSFPELKHGYAQKATGNSLDPVTAGWAHADSDNDIGKLLILLCAIDQNQYHDLWFEMLELVW